MKITQFDNFEWIDFTKPSIEELREFSKTHNLDPNLLYDSMQHGHLPKIEKLENYTFLILRAYSAESSEMVSTIGELSNKIAFFINEKRIITIHRASFRFLEGIAKSQLTSNELLLDIIDSMINSFEEPLNHQSDCIDEIEKIIFIKTKTLISIEDLYYQKSKARICKKLLLFTQNVLGQITLEESLQVKLQDIKDTVIHSLLLYEEVYEDANNLMNTYLSIAAKKSNDVMKLLTVFAAFFMPLTFIVGVYGMNFEHMPELKWIYGYYSSLGVMIIISLIIYIWFKKKKIL